MAEAMKDHALAWAARGFRVFPLAVGSKKPAWKDWDWTEKASNDPSLIEKWWSVAEYNIGVLTNGHIVVDIDMKNGVNGMAAYVDLDLPLDTLIVRTPTGGRHVYFTGPDRQNSAGRLAAGLDTRGHHGYVVGPGSALPTGERYEVDLDLPVAAAPLTLLGALDAPRDRIADPGPAVELDRDDAVARVADFLSSAPRAVEGAGGDFETYRIAARLKDFGVSEDKALDLMLEHWNDDCSPPWAPEDLAVKVANAYAYGSGQPGVLSPHAEFSGVSVAEPVYAAPAPLPEPSQWFDHGDDWNVNVAWLFYKLLPQAGSALLVGPPQAGKTFVALELARCLATGKPFFTVEPDMKGGTILLYAGTEGSGLEERMAALQEPERLPISATRVHGLRHGDKLAQLQEQMKTKSAEMLEKHGVPVRLIVLETLSASGLLEDENSNSQAAEAMSALAILGRNLNALVLVTHHPPKNGGGERGASAIRGSADYVMEIVREGNASIRDLELSKARNAGQRTLGSFSLLPVVLGKDEKGRDVSSLCVSTGAAQTRMEKVAGASGEFMEIMAAVLYEVGEEIEGRQMVTVAEAKAAYRERKSGSHDPSNVAKAWERQIKFAHETGTLEEVLWMGRRYLVRGGVTA